jgi:hypothetical protein
MARLITRWWAWGVSWLAGLNNGISHAPFIHFVVVFLHLRTILGIVLSEEPTERLGVEVALVLLPI